MPCSADFFMANSRLCYEEEVLGGLGQVTGMSLLEAQHRFPPHRLALALDPKARGGEQRVSIRGQVATNTCLVCSFHFSIIISPLPHFNFVMRSTG